MSYDSRSPVSITSPMVRLRDVPVCVSDFLQQLKDACCRRGSIYKCNFYMQVSLCIDAFHYVPTPINYVEVYDTHVLLCYKANSKLLPFDANGLIVELERVDPFREVRIGTSKRHFGYKCTAAYSNTIVCLYAHEGMEEEDREACCFRLQPVGGIRMKPRADINTRS